jgi:hypothetical protein
MLCGDQLATLLQPKVMYAMQCFDELHPYSNYAGTRASDACIRPALGD